MRSINTFFDNLFILSLPPLFLIPYSLSLLIPFFQMKLHQTGPVALG